MGLEHGWGQSWERWKGISSVQDLAMKIRCTWVHPRSTTPGFSGAARPWAGQDSPRAVILGRLPREPLTPLGPLSVFGLRSFDKALARRAAQNKVCGARALGGGGEVLGLKIAPTFLAKNGPDFPCKLAQKWPRLSLQNS